MLSHWSFSLCETRELADCKAQLAAYLQECGAPQNSIEDAQLVAEELIINVLQHGENSESAPVEIACEFTRVIQLTITDQCEAFNPLEEIKPPDMSADDELREEGGYGFLIVSKIVDSMNYHRREGRNILQVKLPFKSTVSS